MRASKLFQDVRYYLFDIKLTLPCLTDSKSSISHSLHKNVVDDFIIFCIDPDYCNNFAWRLESQLTLIDHNWFQLHVASSIYDMLGDRPSFLLLLM